MKTTKKEITKATVKNTNAFGHVKITANLNGLFFETTNSREIMFTNYSAADFKGFSIQEACCVDTMRGDSKKEFIDLIYNWFCNY